MKARHAWMATVALLGVATAAGQIAFVPGNSSWGTLGSFQGSGALGELYYNVSAQTGVYYGTQVSGNTTFFGFVNRYDAGGAYSAPDYDLISRGIPNGSQLTLQFTGLSARPDYIAYTGGALTAYSYSGGTLTLTVATADPVASAADPTGSSIGSAFGLMIVSGSARDFQGAVFRSDMIWEDLDALQNYAGTSYVAGLNANGQNGVPATFYAYLPAALLQANGVVEPDDAQAVVQKSGGAGTVLGGLTLDIYASANPGYTGQSTSWSYAGASAFNFDGVAGNDNFVLATFTNSSWSDGNIGIAAVSSPIPEPSTYALLLGSLALLTALRRRRAHNNATMR